MLVGAFLYKGSRIKVLYVIESEEIVEKHYFGLTPLSSIYSLQFIFSLRSLSKARCPSQACFPLITQAAQGV